MVIDGRYRQIGARVMAVDRGLGAGPCSTECQNAVVSPHGENTDDVRLESETYKPGFRYRFWQLPTRDGR